MNKIYFTLILFFVTACSGRSYTKVEIIESLEQHKMRLHDDFLVLKDEDSGLKDVYQMFALRITKSDQLKLINSFISDVSFSTEKDKYFDIREGKPRYSDSLICYKVFYETNISYVYEYYQPNQMGTKPIWDKITLLKNDTTLLYERILD